MYRIRVIDTLDEIPPVDEVNEDKVISRSALLSHLGGDRIDNLIIGSSLEWVFAGLDCRDGKYSELFTGDENRFRVEMEDVDGNMMWQGFLLPDAYQEPYRNYVQDVSFMATDGLARLKSKHLGVLPKEVSVIDVISRCLRLTGLSINLRFAPSFVNSKQKDYRQIWINSEFIQDMNAYAILEELCKTLGCNLYQSDNYWNFEGWGYRFLRNYFVEIYSSTGVLVDSGVIERNIKKVTALKGGLIDVVPPYGYIETTFTKKRPQFHEELTSMESQSWSDNTTNPDDNSVYAIEWVMDSQKPMLANKEDGVYFIPDVVNGDIEPSGSKYYIRNQPFVREDAFYRLTFSIKLEISLKEPKDWPETVQIGSITTPFFVSISNPDNALKYQITIDGIPIIGDPNAPSVDANGVVEVDFTSSTGEPYNARQYVNRPPDEPWSIEFRSPRSGLLNVEIYNRMGVNIIHNGNFGDLPEIDDLNFRVVIDDLNIEEIFEQDNIDSGVIDNTENYTLEKKTTLVFGGDASGQDGSLKLEPNNLGTEFETFSGQSTRFYNNFDVWNIVTDLRLANLVDNFPENVTDVLGDKIDVIDVEYNWLLSQEHAIRSENVGFSTPNSPPTYRVAVPTPNITDTSRTSWEKWSSTFHTIEDRRLVDAYSDFIFDLFGNPLFRSELQVLNNVKINDILSIDYKGVKDFAITSSQWDIDKGITNIVAISSPFKDNPIPPSVEITNIDYIDNNSVKLYSQSISPFGEIEQYNWYVINGSATIVNGSTPSPNVNLNGMVEIGVDVTDSNGNVGSDSIILYERVTVEVKLPNRRSGTLPYAGDYSLELPIELNEIEGDLPQNYIINVNGTMTLQTSVWNTTGEERASFLDGDRVILKVNDVVVMESDISLDTFDLGFSQSLYWEDKFSINLRKGDNVSLEVFADEDRDNENRLSYTFRLDRAIFVRGAGEIIGPPTLNT